MTVIAEFTRRSIRITFANSTNMKALVEFMTAIVEFMTVIIEFMMVFIMNG